MAGLCCKRAVHQLVVATASPWLLGLLCGILLNLTTRTQVKRSTPSTQVENHLSFFPPGFGRKPSFIRTQVEILLSLWHFFYHDTGRNRFARNRKKPFFVRDTGRNPSSAGTQVAQLSPECMWKSFFYRGTERNPSPLGHRYPSFHEDTGRKILFPPDCR